MAEFYMLVNGEIVPTDDVFEWSKWRKNPSNVVVNKTVFFNRFRAIAKEKIVLVSTVCIGVCHGFDAADKPLIFETMIFGLPGDDEYVERYATVDEARIGHERACKSLNRFWWKPAG